MPIIFPVTILAAGGAVVQISQGAGTNIGNMTGNGGLAAAFDGTTDQSQAAVAYRTGGEGTCGKDYGSGVTKTVVRWVAYGANGGIGFNNWPSNGALNLYCEYSSDGSSWNIADSLTWDTSGSGPVDRTFASVGAYRYWRFRGNDGAADIRLAELQFWEQT